MSAVEINPFKSLQENANSYFEKSKKARAKLKGLEKAMQELKAKAENAESAGEERQGPEKKRKREWFEKFRWFYTSKNSLLCIAGKDRQSNEQLVKKHMLPEDLYFHAEIQGAAHCIIKEGIAKAEEQDKKEAAGFAAVHSKAWSSGISAVDVYSVRPEQVSKQAQSGEALGSGAFMIYGEREWHRKTALEFAVGIDENGRIISGPLEAVKARAKAFERLEPGSIEKSEMAKKLKTAFEKKTGLKASLDELISAIPGSSALKKS